MGENIKVDEKQSAERLREQIGYTESHITETVHTLEQRLSPRYIRQRGTRKAKLLAWQGTARFLDLAQRTSVQASLLGAGVLLMLMRNKKGHDVVGKPSMRERREAERRERRKSGTAAKAAGASALWLLSRKNVEKAGEERSGKKPVSGVVLAATAAKAFLGGARASEKRGTTQPGRKVAWRGMATAIGAALGSYWYSHKQHKA